MEKEENIHTLTNP